MSWARDHLGKEIQETLVREFHLPPMRHLRLSVLFAGKDSYHGTFICKLICVDRDAADEVAAKNGVKFILAPPLKYMTIHDTYVMDRGFHDGRLSKTNYERKASFRYGN
jgi:hypothetical protein